VNYQLFAVLAVIGAAVLYLLTVAVRAWRRVRQGKCSTGCGCAPKPKIEQPELIGAKDLTLRLQRKRHA